MRGGVDTGVFDREVERDLFLELGRDKIRGEFERDELLDEFEDESGEADDGGDESELCFRGGMVRLHERREIERLDVSFGFRVNFGRGRFVVGLGGEASETVFA